MRKLGALGVLLLLLVLLPPLGHTLNLSGSGGGALLNPEPCPTGLFVKGITNGALDCEAPDGGGNVSNTGTPLPGQLAVWTSATVLQGIPTTGTGDGVRATAPTLSLRDSLTTFHDDGDPSKQMRLQLSAIPPATTIVLTTPPTTGTLLSDNNVITVVGKTFQDAAFLGTTTGITKAMVGLSAVDNASNVQERATTRTLTNATLDPTNTITVFGSLFTLQDPTTPSKQGRFSLANNTAVTLRTYTLFDASDTVMCLTCPQTATNKTFTAPSINALANLAPLNGFVKTGGAVGTLSVDTTVYAQTGVDINASHQVTITHLAAPLPVAQGGTGLALGISGGIPYFNTTTSMLSSAVLGAGLPVLGGGSGAAPIAGGKSGNQTTFVTLFGPATSGTCAQFDANGNVASSGSACTTGPGGSGTVNAGTVGQLGYYGTSGTAISGNANATISAGAVTLGSAGVLGQLLLTGNTSGLVTLRPAAAAGTWTLTLPITAGSSGQFLQTNGAGVTTWATGSGTITISGTPTANQIATWFSGTALQGETASGTGAPLRSVNPAITAPTGLVKGDVGLSFVDNTSNVQERAAVRTLTNATLDNTNTLTLRDDRFTLQDDGNTGRQVVFQLSGLSVATRTWTFPDVSGTFASTSGPQTLANTTLASGLFTTSLTGPLLIGGTGAASSLTLQSTSGAGTTDSIVAKVGIAGAVTAWTTDTTGNFGLGVVPSAKLHILGASAEIRQAGSGINQTLLHTFLDNNVTLAGSLSYQGAAAAGGKNVSLRSNAADAVEILAVNDVPVKGGTNNLERWRYTSAAYTVGFNGPTNPALRVNYAPGVATGWDLTAQVAGARAQLSVLSSGTDEGGDINAKGAGTLRLQSTSTGNVLMGGETARTFGMERRTGSTNAGLGMTLSPGGAAVGALNAAGGDTDISPGKTTGTGRSLTKIKCEKPATASGTGDNPAIDCVIFGAVKRLADNVTTGVLALTIANNSSVSVQIEYGVEVKDAGNVQQVEGGRVVCTAVNVGGTVSQNVCQKVGNLAGISNDPSSTNQIDWTITAANPAMVSVISNSSLTPSPGYPQLNMPMIHNLTSQAMVVQ
jgi:hypothetical protein